MCIVVQVTLNMAEYGSQRPDQPENVNFEPIIRGLKSDIFDSDQVWMDGIGWMGLDGMVIIGRW